MALNFNPEIYRLEDKKKQERDDLMRSLQLLGQGIGGYNRNKRENESADLDQAIKMAQMQSQYGSIGTRKILKPATPIPGAYGPTVSPEDFNYNDPAQAAQGERFFGESGVKPILAATQRGYDQREQEARIRKTEAEAQDGNGNSVKQPTSVEAYLMREVQSGRMTLDDAIAKINQAKPPKSEQPMSPENAGKLSMATSAIGDVDTVINSLFDKNGRVDRARLFSANFSIPFMRGGIPFTEGRGIDSAIENAIAAKLRAETGAAATPEEIRHVSNRFRPNLRDDDMTIKNKLLRLRSALAGGVELADPSGAYRERQGAIPPPPENINRVGLSPNEQSELEELEKIFGGGM